MPVSEEKREIVWNRWFNTAAFAAAAPGTFGNARRNTVIGPRNNIGDLSLVKSTRINERAHLQFRAEVFNIFNHPNFALPNVTVNSGAFGSIASTPDVANGNPLGDGGPRQVHVALRMEF